MRTYEYNGPTYVLVDWANIKKDWTARTRFGKFLMLPIVTMAAILDIVFLFVFVGYLVKQSVADRVYGGPNDGDS